MNIEELFNQKNIVDLSFFNFRNAITAAFFADRELRIQRVNENFRSFFPVLGNVTNAYFPDVLSQLGVDQEQVESFQRQLNENHSVLIPQIPIVTDGKEKMFSLLSTFTQDESFSYLNGIQGQFVDRTAEHQLRREKEELLNQRLSDQQLIEEKSKQLENLANRLAKYLAPQIYESIFASNADVRQGCSRKNLTIFFSDIVGFADISDGIDPERLEFVINKYLTEMSDIAMEYGGTIDKFIGDAMLVFFGDPETEGEKNDAIRCIMMATRMRDRIRELQDVWQSHGISQPFRVRMGINTGFCTVGNFGSDQRLDYTVIGSPVNLAARLQSNAEPDSILVSETTWLLVRDVAQFTEAGEMMLKGFSRPTKAYRLDTLDSSLAEKIQSTVEHVGRHVEVKIRDKNRIREAIEELKAIEEEFTANLDNG